MTGRRILEHMDASDIACDFIENVLGRHNYPANWKKLAGREEAISAWMERTGRTGKVPDIIDHIEAMVKAGHKWIG